jgi:hypothetical protein
MAQPAIQIHHCSQSSVHPPIQIAHPIHHYQPPTGPNVAPLRPLDSSRPTEYWKRQQPMRPPSASHPVPLPKPYTPRPYTPPVTPSTTFPVRCTIFRTAPGSPNGGMQCYRTPLSQMPILSGWRR